MPLARPKSRSHSLAYAILAGLFVISCIQWVRNSGDSVYNHVSGTLAP